MGSLTFTPPHARPSSTRVDAKYRKLGLTVGQFPNEGVLLLNPCDAPLAAFWKCCSALLVVAGFVFALDRCCGSRFQQFHEFLRETARSLQPRSFEEWFVVMIYVGVPVSLVILGIYAILWSFMHYLAAVRRFGPSVLWLPSDNIRPGEEIRVSYHRRVHRSVKVVELQAWLRCVEAVWIDADQDSSWSDTTRQEIPLPRLSPITVGDAIEVSWGAAIPGESLPSVSEANFRRRWSIEVSLKVDGWLFPFESSFPVVVVPADSVGSKPRKPLRDQEVSS